MTKELYIRRIITYDFSVPFTSEYYATKDIEEAVKQEKDKDLSGIIDMGELSGEGVKVTSFVEIIDGNSCGNSEPHEAHYYGEHNEEHCCGLSIEDFDDFDYLNG